MAKIKGKMVTRMKPNGEVVVKYSGNFSKDMVESIGYAQARALADRYGYSGTLKVIFIDKDLTRRL